MEPEQVDALLDLMENYLMSLSYKTVFEFISTADEDKDLAIQKRIRSLSWVAAQHLELELDDRYPPVRDIMDRAITGGLIAGVLEGYERQKVHKAAVPNRRTCA